MFKKTLLIFTLLVSPVFAQYTETVVLYPQTNNGDTYIEYNDASNHGGYQYMKVLSSPFPNYNNAIALMRFDMGSLNRYPSAARLILEKNTGSSTPPTFSLCTTDGTWTDSSTYAAYSSHINYSTTVYSSINISGGVITIPLSESYITADYAFLATTSSNWSINATGSSPKLELDYSTSVVGDSNFDGDFDSADLVQVLQLGKYESGIQDATWSSGDWNGDGYFNSSDFVTAFQASTYEDGAEALEDEIEANF